MTLFVTVLHVMVCLVLILVVLLQRGKGAEIGAVFGGGGGSTVFGSRGAGNFLTRLTTGSAVVFMVTSLTLAYFARQSAESTLFEEAPAAVEETTESPFGEAGEAPAAASEPGKAERMGRAARRRIQSVFRWDDAAAGLVQVFEETLRATHRRSRAA